MLSPEGQVLELTYPKRAAGLVAKGRARYENEYTIRLVACPPENSQKFPEDTEMESQANMPETLIPEDKVFPPAKLDVDKLDVEYILTRIDRIIADTAYIHEAIASLNDMSPQSFPDGANLSMYGGDYAGQARGEAIASIAQCRETTNQQMIRLLEKMYDDLKINAFGKDANGEIDRFKSAVEALAPLAVHIDADEAVKNLIERTFH